MIIINLLLIPHNNPLIVLIIIHAYLVKLQQKISCVRDLWWLNTSRLSRRSGQGSSLGRLAYPGRKSDGSNLGQRLRRVRPVSARRNLANGRPLRNIYPAGFTCRNRARAYACARYHPGSRPTYDIELRKGRAPRKTFLSFTIYLCTLERTRVFARLCSAFVLPSFCFRSSKPWSAREIPRENRSTV